MNCTVFDGFGGMVVWISMGPPNIHDMLGLSRAMHVHVLGIHVHSITHIGNVMSWGHLCWLLAYTRVQHLVCLLEWSLYVGYLV